MVNKLINTSLFSYLATMLLVFAVNIWVLGQSSLWILYALALGLGTWNLGRTSGLVMAGFSLLLLVTTVFVWGHPYNSLGHLFWACASETAGQMVLVLLVSALRTKEIHRAFYPNRVGKQSTPGQDVA